MKRPTPKPSLKSCAGFTLVELLVVIAIIVILMSLLLTAVPAVKKAAGKAEARNTCNMVVTAINAYYTEYATFPPTAAAGAGDPAAVPTDIVVGDPSFAAMPNNTVFYTLRNIARGPNEGNVANPRKVVFYEGKVAKASGGGNARNGFYDRDKDGAPPGALQESCLYDPWGKQYGVILDLDGDDRINLEGYYSDFTGATADGRAPRRKVGAFSAGEDEVLGSTKAPNVYRGVGETSDDVLSWEQ